MAALKYSRQREAVLELLKSTNTHPTAEWIYINLKKDFPKISLATVYRNLSQLCDAGYVRKIPSVDSVEHYDGFTEPHYHFICSKCRRVFDMDTELIPEIAEIASHCSDYSIKSYSLVFYGECDECGASEAV